MSSSVESHLNRSTGSDRPRRAVRTDGHREVREALSGLLLAMFVAMLSSTIVCMVGGLLVSTSWGPRPRSRRNDAEHRPCQPWVRLAVDPRSGHLPAPVREVFEHAFGEATGHIFLIALPFAVLSLLLLLFIEEKPMRDTVLREDEIAAAAQREPAEL